jgi:methionine-S-sulfoxide reductase
MKIEKAILAGGCFWGMEDIIQKTDGVLNTQVGYTGGTTPNPTYHDVKTGKTQHAEAILIEFDSNTLTFENLLRLFFKMHDPTTPNSQGGDVGSQYRSAIFYLNEEQKTSAEKIIIEVDQSKKWPKPIVTEVVGATQFYDAEDYHQDYLLKNPGGYTCHWIRN